MNCDRLPVTGVSGTLSTIIVVAIACLVVGLTMLLVARSRRPGAAALLVAILVGVTLTALPPRPAGAATADCVTTENTLTVLQTSTMAGLAPGVEPVAITGVVMNNGADPTDIGTVVVEIESVTTTAGSPPGVCDASDYVVVDERMSVGRRLEPGGSTTFEGASIGFRNKATNQDACRTAVIHLLYTANPN